MMNPPEDELRLVPIVVAEEEVVDRPAGASYEEHGGRSWRAVTRTKVATVDMADLQESVGRIQQQLDALAAASASGGGWGIREVKARLAVSAKGGIGLVAAAGIEAAVEITFRKSAA
ncbi:hypothetical protein [Kitasatospora sp. NPDC005856]|uniref:Pepco domain-containing protein n=1 Tax=Kitasatospora sp. NPDC005856 TaxID=3154566 RepID=UPI0033E6AF0B